MNDKDRAYHSAQAKKNPNYYRELELFYIEMFGLSDEELHRLMTPEEIKEYREFLERLYKPDTSSHKKYKENQ